jgi:hypothetical protein
MHRALLGLVVTAALAVPASAQNFVTSGFGASSAFGDSRFGSPPPVIGPCRFLTVQRGRNSRHIRVADVLIGGGGYGAGGYYDYGDYDANRSFSPDKWNDWWHERPERAYPRWMSHNEGCERPWYSGSVLVC